MVDTAAAQLRRILAVIPYFADDQDHDIEEVAALAGTSRRQIIKDFDSITNRFDVPGHLESVQILVDETMVSMIATNFHRPMRLTMPELCALELGLAMLRLERTPADHAAIDRALTRLRATISQLPSNDAHDDLRHASLADVGSAEHLSTLRAAVRDRQVVMLRYRAGGATESVERRVCPHAIVYSEHMWYVVTIGEDGALRHFRLDRMERVDVVEGHFESDATVVRRVMEAGRAFASETTRYMTVRYSPRIARWVAEREGESLAADGSLTLDHPVADDSWAMRHVLQYGPEAEVIAPPEMRQMLAMRLADMGSGERD
jgi:proteasome accessory factor C